MTGLPGLANSGGVSVASGATLSASAIINNAGATIGTSGTLASLVTPLINSGTVNANGGAVNGAIDNKNAFNVGGTVSSNSTFLNESGANLSVNSGAYTVTGVLTNAGSLAVSSGAAFTDAAGVANASGGTIFNYGAITDALTNSGTVTNNGTYNANVALNNGTINNLGTWNGVVDQYANVANGVINNSGTWAGTGVSYNDGGTINNTGSWSGGLINDQGMINNSGVITGGLTNSGGYSINTGTINGGTTVTGGMLDSFASSSVINGGVNVSGSGVVYALNTIGGNVGVSGNGVFYVGDHSAATTNPTLGQTLSVSGSVTGPITIPVNMATGASNTINVGGSTAGASTNLTGQLQNPANLVWTTPNHTLTYSNASIPLSGTSLQTLYALSSQPFSYFSYTPTSGNNGVLQSLKLGAVSAPASQIASILTALNSSFFQNAQAFLGVPTNPTANFVYGGIWSRAGGAAITMDTTASGGNSPTTLSSHSLNDIGGFQFGIDEGLYNINNSKMNVHLGITAGEAFASASDQFPGNAFESAIGVNTNANVPFYGVYAALTGNGLAATVQWRRNLFDLNLNDQYLGGNGQRTVDAAGNTYSADLSYNLPFGDGYVVTPGAAVFVSRTNINDLAVPSPVAGYPESVFSFASLNSTLGRFGARLVKPFQLNDDLIIAPYLSMNVWNEFQGGSTTYFTQQIESVSPVYTSSLGTFGQVSLGFSTQSPKAGFTSYLQADLRVGSNIQGWGVIGGLRYSY